MSVVKAFRLLKLLRLRRLNTLITNLNQPVAIKSQLKRLYVIFILVLICHIQGCVIYMIVVSKQYWIPPLDFGSISTDVFDPDRGFLFHYFKMFYHSALVYSMVDISVRTFDELMLVGLLILISAIINAIIYGQFAILTEELKRDSNEFLDKLNLVNTVMNDQSLPLPMKEEIRNFILTTHSLQRLQAELIAFNENISPSLR